MDNQEWEQICWRLRAAPNKEHIRCRGIVSHAWFSRSPKLDRGLSSRPSNGHTMTNLVQHGLDLDLGRP
nr:hypothetical protein Iba_chr08aCG13590 [Ipomoea batatas]